MDKLNSVGKAGDFDRIYDDVVEAFADLNEEQCLELAAALLIVLANHVGDEKIIQEAIEIAKESLDDSA